MGSLTRLRAAGSPVPLGKSYTQRPDGSIDKTSAPTIAEFVVDIIDYEDSEGLFEAFEALSRDPYSCVVRAGRGRFFPQDPTTPVYRRLEPRSGNPGRPGWADRSGRMDDGPQQRRNEMLEKAGKQPVPCNVSWLGMFREVGTDHVAFDIDGLDWPHGGDWVNDLEHTAGIVRDSKLPPEFKGSSCWVQATGSALDPTKRGKPEWAQLRLRLVFKLTRALTDSQLTQWIKGYAGIDPATLRTHQIIYTANPSFKGLRDHLPQRTAVLWDEADEVVPPEIADRIGAYDEEGGEFVSAIGAGLVDCEAFEEALTRITSKAGECRSRCGQAAAVYARAVGRNNVDGAALVERIRQEALRHRSTAEVNGYGLKAFVYWHVSNAPAEPAGPVPPFDEPANDDNPAPEPEVGATVEEASATLAETVRQWVDEGLAYSPDYVSTPPRHAIRAAAGIGKTTVTLQALADLAAGKTTHFYVPTHSLAEELKAKAVALGIPCEIVLGRSRVDPDNPRFSDGTERKMCQKAELAEVVAGCGLPVWESLCSNEGETAVGNLEHRCQFFTSCSYVRQFDRLDGKLVIMPHKWLTLPRRKLPQPELAVIDERFYPIGVRKSQWTYSRITRPLQIGIDGVDYARQQRTADAVAAALWAGEHPRDHSVTEDDLAAAAKAERAAWTHTQIVPAMPTDQQRRLAKEFAEAKEHRHLTRIYRLLEEDYKLPHPSPRVHVVKGEDMGGQLVDNVHFHWTDFRVPKAPTLLIDADADPVITEAIWADVQFTTIKPPMQAHVVQVKNTACSRHKLLESSAATRNQNRVVALAAREADAGNKTLLVGYKAMIEEVGELHEIETLHFGALRGLDRYKHFDTVIIAGREQTQAVKCEAVARALYHKDAEPLVLPGNYEKSRRRYRTRDGIEHFGPVHLHPDARVQAIVEQGRECETVQAVARLRLIHRDKPARVLLLSNLPTELVVDDLTSWSALLPNKAETAAQKSGGIELLSPSELSRVFPERWATAKAAKRWQERNGHGLAKAESKGPETLYTTLIGKRGLLPPRMVAYRLHGQYRAGRPHRAWIPAEHCGSLFEAADALARVVGEEPATIEWGDERDEEGGPNDNITQFRSVGGVK